MTWEKEMGTKKTVKKGRKLKPSPAASKKSAVTGSAGMIAALANAYLTLGAEIGRDPKSPATIAASALATRYMMALVNYVRALEEGRRNG